MTKILFDKINNRESDVAWFTDQYGDHWIDTDPYGLQMSGKFTIRFLNKNDIQYEIRSNN